MSSILTIGLLTGCTTPNQQPTDAASPTASETPAPTTAANTDSSPKLTVELGQLDTWVKSQIRTIPAAKKVLFTAHDALGYYSKADGIPVDALEGSKSLSQNTLRGTK